jgi:predicted permease
MFQIAGIADARFTGVEPGRPTDVWLPYASYNPRAFGNASFNWFRIMGRMKSGLPPEAARSVLQAAFTAFRRDRGPAFSGSGTAAERQRRIEAPLYVRAAANGLSPLRRQFERPLWILAAIAGLVLAIAGANAGNLFLARAAAREREMAVRVSIGAGRARLLQQVLVESALVAAAACALGLLFAAVTAPAVVDLLASADDPVRLDLHLDWRVAAFAALITVATTMLFGLAPALRASHVAPLAALKGGESRAGARVAVMRPFVVLQVAFGLAVLFVGGLLVHSFASLASVNPGFTASNLVLLNVEPTRRVDAGVQRTALLAVIERLRLVPGVEWASAAEFNALGRAWTYTAHAPGAPQDDIEATLAPVSDGYFETMKIPLVSGRTFVRRDIDAVPPDAVVVNTAFAARYFGAQQAVGRVFEARLGEYDAGPGRHQIVGVVGDTRYDLRRAAAPVIYLPLRTNGTVHVRVGADAAAAAVRLRDAVRAADSLFRVSSVTLQSEVIERTLLRERLLATLAAFFAAVGLVLVAVGVYGVLSYAVVHRTREIGIRLALGARPLIVVRTVVAATGGAVAVGAASGLAAGLYLSRFVRSLLFEVSPLDPVSIAAPLVLLVLAASLSALLPALRAARIEPVIALRQE